MPTGTVVAFNDEKGYGFLDSDAVDEEVFVHMADVGGPNLEAGQAVAFVLERAGGGPRATNVTRL